jgi:hypothetical protein
MKEFKSMLLKIVLMVLLPVNFLNSMEICVIPIDLMPSIIKHAIWSEAKNNAWNIRNATVLETIKKTHSLQLVCKYFERFFWDCFSQEEKDGIICYLLRYKSERNGCLVDMALRSGARLSLILHHFIKYSKVEKDALNVVADVVAVADAQAMNALSVHEEITPLHSAVKHCTIPMVKLLLTSSVIDVNLTVPLSTAVSPGRIEKMKLLLAHPDIHVNTCDEYGETALFGLSNNIWSGTENLLTEAIDLLIRAGIDETIQNESGKTALDIARYEAQQIVADKLAEALEKKNNV